MQRCSGYDAHFIYDERPEEPQHTLKISIFGPEASARHSLESFKRELRARLPDIPPLRWRAVRVPLDLYHPVWVDTGEVDLDRHVHRLALPAPGGRAELCEVVSQLASHCLDPRRPLWEIWLLEGFEGGRLVSVLKMSHALADGGASRELIERLYSSQPLAETETLPSTPPLVGERVPSKVRLVWDALRDRVRDFFVEIPRLVGATRRARARVRTARREGRAPESSQLSALSSPATPFAGPLSRHRGFHYTTASLGHAKEIARALDCTINDVVVATAAGGVRRYLGQHGALPDGPTLGILPASIRAEHERGTWGNRISIRTLDLPTHLADPLERLRASQRAARAVKTDLALRQGSNLEDWERFLPPSVPKTIGRLARTVARLRPQLPAGVTISNVAGPPELLHTLGGPVENFISVGHMKYIAGLNITVWSYAGRLNFALYACAEAVPDLWRLSDLLAEAFEELHKAATLPRTADG